jgi:hypothetical protein
MTSFCPNCGVEILEDYAFCVNCGSELQNIGLKSKDSRSDMISSLTYKKSLRNRRLIILGGTLVIVISFAIVVTIGLNWLSRELGPYKYAGTVDYYVDDDIYLTKLNLEVNNYRSVNISIEPGLDYHFHAKIIVSARGDYNEEDVDTFKETVIGSEVSLVFEPEDYWSEFTTRKYSYELQIYISNYLETRLNIDCPYGDILFSANSTNIDSISLYSSWGNVTADFLNTTFGGDDDTFNAIDSNSGIAIARFINSSFTVNETRMTLYSGEKYIELFVDQEICDNESFHYVDYYLEANIINFTYHISSDIGVGITTFSPASIHTSGLPSQIIFPYFTDDYELASLQYFFDMHCYDGTLYINSI